MTRADVEEQSLTAWKEIPTACGFRVPQPQVNGVRRRATHADRLAQQQTYAKCRSWALQCGLTDEEFQSNLEAVPSDFNQRGVASLPAFLQSRHCSSWEHARLLCVSMSIPRIAADAGKRLGGETMAKEAAAEVLKLMSSEDTRLSRLFRIPQSWRDDEALRLPTGSHRPASGIKPLPGFFEMWLRDQAAALMGRHAAEHWRTAVRQEAESPAQSWSERLSQRLAARQQSPSQFVLDGATCRCLARSSHGAHAPHPMTTAWHGFLWKTACEEVRSVANHGSFLCHGFSNQDILVKSISRLLLICLICP